MKVKTAKRESRRFQNRDLAKALDWWGWHSLRTRFHEEGFQTITNMFCYSVEIRKLHFLSPGAMDIEPVTFGLVEFADAAVGVCDPCYFSV